MDTKAKVLTFAGALLLVGLVAYLVLVHGRKPSATETTDEQTAPKTEIALGPSTQPATAPVDPFASPATLPTTEPVVAIPTPESNDPMIRALDMGPAGMGSHNGTMGIVAAEPTQTTTPKTWKVATGDTLASISTKAYGSSRYSSKIAAANPRVNTRSLRAGTVLTLPEINTTPAASTDHNTAAGSATPALTGKTYTVKSGDSLRKISAKVYGNQKMWEKIYELNRRLIGSDPTRLRAGMVLQLPEAPARAAQ